MQLIPHEFVLFTGIYLSPLLVGGFLGLLATVATFRALQRYRLTRFFAWPPVAALSLLVIYTIFISTFIIPA